jgi:hypothetical protein
MESGMICGRYRLCKVGVQLNKQGHLGKICKHVLGPGRFCLWALRSAPGQRLACWVLKAKVGKKYIRGDREATRSSSSASVRHGR